MSKFTGVLAWHPEVAMTEDETNDFLSGRWVARMATIGRDGYPVVTPLWYLWDGKCLYFNIAKTRQSPKNLARNPRVSVVIDMDDGPLMGMRTNLAKAGSGQKVRIDAGPYAGEYLPEEAIGFITNRDGLTKRDGAIGLTREGFRQMYSQEGIEESQLYKDNIGRVFTKIVPRRIRTWDFSKAPIGVSDGG